MTKQIGFIETGKGIKVEDKIQKSYEKVKRFIDLDSEITLLQMRVTVELICKEIYRKENHVKPKSNVLLREYINSFMEDTITPKEIAVHLSVIDIYTTIGNEEREEKLREYIEPCFESLTTIVNWYLGGSKKDGLHPTHIKHNQTNSYYQTVQPDDEKLDTSNFATLQVMKKMAGDDGLIIGKQLRLSSEKSFEHYLCVGPTGSGKSASFFIPNLLSLPNASIVVSDPKGELFEKTAATNLAQGKQVLVFSPYHKNTMRYNPLSLCRTVNEVRELAQVILTNGNASIEAMTGVKGGGSEWLSMSTPLLTAFLLYVKNLSPPKNTVSYALQLIIENDIETLKFLMMDNDADIWEQTATKNFNIFLQSAESEKTAASIRTVLASNLQIFADPLIEEATSFNEINPADLRKQPTVLYVLVPEHKSDIIAPLMAPFYKQLMETLIDGDTSIPVYFMLDEFANIGIIPNIDTALATFRSRRISISIGIQSLNQLKHKYHDKTDSILDNLNSKCILPGLAYDSADYFSKLCGYKEIKTRSQSYNTVDGTLSYSTSPQKRELVSPSEIRRLDDETLIAIMDNLNPFQDSQFRYYKDREMLALTENQLNLENYIDELRESLDLPEGV